MNRLIVLLLCTCLLGITAAQTKNIDNIPVDNTDYKSNCYSFEVKMYTAATDISQSYEDMQKEYLAAQAYAQLDKLNQGC